MPVIDVSEQLARIPAQPLAARLILRLVEDPEVSTAQLARLVETDPVLSARVIRLANSPHYAIRDGVHSAARAVILLGVSTVRGLAAAAATQLLSDNVRLGPTDSWAHSVTVAAASAVAGEVLDIADNESFSAGLLHDVGSTLFYSAAPDAYTEMIAGVAAGELDGRERSTYGMTHAEAGAAALEQWGFPIAFVRAVRDHHEPISVISQLAQTIVFGEAIAESVQPLGLPERSVALGQVIKELGLAPRLVADVKARTTASLTRIGDYLSTVR